MQQLWIYKRFNRRIFLALLFVLFTSKKTISANNPNTVKCDWCWIGAVTDSSITIKAKLNNKAIVEKNYIQVFYHQTPNLDFDARNIKKTRATLLEEQIATFNLVDLTEDTVYYYIIVADGRKYPAEGTLQFKTVKVNRPYNFAIACSSCAGGTLSQLSSSGVSNSRVFKTIRNYTYKTENGRDSNLALFIHMGDLHYRNDLPTIGLQENYLDDYRHNYDLVMSQSKQRDLYQNIPLAYIWDDHDYGTNDSDGSYNLKYLASKAYREQVPCYPLVEGVDVSKGQGAIYQSFIIGRVRFIMTDSRFHQEPINTWNGRAKSLLGNNQKLWLLKQLQTGKRQQQNNQEGLTIWVNNIPWIAKPDNSKIGSWNKFEQERNEIANYIKVNEIDKLLMISGDAHMLAIDDGTPGTANNYGTNGGGSFPVIQAASLDSTGSFKGGPYNGEKYIVNSNVRSINGAIPGKGHWGLLNFIDDGNKIKVNIELKRMEDTLIQHTFTF